MTSRPLLCILFWLHLACEDVSFASLLDPHLSLVISWVISA